MDTPDINYFFPQSPSTNIDLCRYDDTGRILVSMNVSSEARDYIIKQDPFILHAKGDTNTQYVDVSKGKLIERPDMDCELIDNTIVGLPGPGYVTIDHSTRYECEGDEIELDIEVSGEYHILVQCWPYKDKVFTLTIN